MPENKGTCGECEHSRPGHSCFGYRGENHKECPARTSERKLLEDIKFLLSFVPEWAKEAPPGLCATMYGTLTQAGDQKVVDRVKEITKLYSEPCKVDRSTAGFTCKLGDLAPKDKKE